MTLKDRLAALKRHDPRAATLADAIPEQISAKKMEARRKAALKKALSRSSPEAGKPMAAGFKR